MNIKLGQRRAFIYFLSFLLLLVPTLVKGQSNDQGAVVVQSWRRGNDKITEKHLTLDFNEGESEFEIDIPNEANTKSYRMSLKKVFTKTPTRTSMQCWSITLDNLFEYKGGGFILGGNLLSIEAGYGDNIPGFENIFCPLDPPTVFDKGHLAIKKARKFLVEGFSVELNVLKYVYDEKAIRMKNLSIAIDLKNQTDTKSK
ncbi:MAG TPA: hypothetical protein VGO50_18550 [Pyrinomonadaceae bacterium]|jgi:hypothetical protein|nr:hypothetical protein [Pyrinomonadaceae bacterium]